MKASTKRALSLLGTIFLFLASIVFFTAFVSPEYNDINKLRGEFSVSQELYNEQTKIIDKVKALIEQYKGTAIIQDIARTLPQDEGTASIVHQLNGIAANSGVVLQSLNLQTMPLRTVSPNVPQGIKSIGTVQITLRIAGPYENFKTFLGRVETNIRLMDIVDWRIESTIKTAFSYNVIINAYYQSK